jgi:hypothetical protein
VTPVEFHPEHYEIVYLPAHALPEMTDAGGASAGASGAAGGAALHTPEQVIRIVRGNPIIPHVVDVPRLALPRTEAPANLLVSSAPAPSVPPNAIQRERITTVQAFAVTSAVAPAPEIVRERTVAEPLLPVAPIPPPVSTAAHNEVIGGQLELPKPVAPPPEKITRNDALAAIRPGVPPPDVKVVNVGSMAPPRPETSVIMSSQPGAAVGKPDSQTPGAIAMSPTGAGKPGVGEGFGSSAARGTSTGTAANGNGPAATATGKGPGESTAAVGIAPGTGPGGGGAGMVAGGVPGVTISGGKVIVPSFGSGTQAHGGSARMPKEQHNMRPVTIVATASSGGAITARSLLKGAKVYTIYIDTSAGLAFLQFSEHAATGTQTDLTAPEPLLSPVPVDLRSARILLAGIMDRNGSLRELRVVNAASQELAQHLIDAVQRWHFRPALRGDDPVEVDAVFGLNVDTK